MNKILTFGLLTLATVMLTACSNEVDISKHIDPSKPMELVIRDKADSNGFLNPKLITLTPDDARFNQFIKWGTNNSADWESAIASYAPGDAKLIQGDFNLNYYSTGYIVVNYKDEEGKLNQIKKEVNPDDFLFLLK